MAPATYPNGRITNSHCGEQSRTAVDRYSYTDKTTSRDDSSMFVSFVIFMIRFVFFFSIETFLFSFYPFFFFFLIQEPKEEYLIRLTDSRNNL